MIEHDNTAASSREQTVITFLGFKADALNLVAIEKTLDEFMEVNQDVFITYEGIKGLPYYDALEARQGAGALDDIMMLDHDHILTLSSEGLLEDLSELTTLDNYIPWAREQFTADDGSVYFIPTCISTYNLYINTDLLETHGQKLPENLDEFTQVCDYFVSQGITPVIANNYASLSTLILAKGMYPVYSSDNSLEQIQKFNSGEADMAEQLRPGFELVKQMLERGWLDGEEVVSTNQTSDDLAIFSEGERPFMVTGGWASPRLNVDFSYDCILLGKHTVKGVYALAGVSPPRRYRWC